MPVVVGIVDPAGRLTRLEIAPKAVQLHELGMTYREIAKALGVSEKTVARAIRDTRAGLRDDGDLLIAYRPDRQP
jgi:predicted transcriptional regulator